MLASWPADRMQTPPFIHRCSATSLRTEAFSLAGLTGNVFVSACISHHLPEPSCWALSPTICMYGAAVARLTCMSALWLQACWSCDLEHSIHSAVIAYSCSLSPLGQACQVRCTCCSSCAISAWDCKGRCRKEGWGNGGREIGECSIRHHTTEMKQGHLCSVLPYHDGLSTILFPKSLQVPMMLLKKRARSAL